MTVGSSGGVGVRLFVQGQEIVKQVFGDIGSAGRKMWADVAAGEGIAKAPLEAISRTSETVKDKIHELAGETGSAANILGSFGVAGIGLAGALGGAILALDKTKEAMEFGDQIQKTAEKLKVSTDTVQEWRYAILQFGGSAEDADSALQGFTQALGQAESGLSPKLMKAFAALGFTREQLKSFDSVDAALKAVTDRISGLGSEAERAGVAQKLGLTPLLPALREGSGAVEKLRQDAHDLGFVMEADIVEKLGKANDKFESASQVIRVKFMSAFVDLAPILLQTTDLIAKMIDKVDDLLESFKKVEDTSTNALRRRQASDIDTINRLSVQKEAASKSLLGSFSPFDRVALENAQKDLAAIQVELTKRAEEDAARAKTGQNTGGTGLIDQTKQHGLTEAQKTERREELYLEEQVQILRAGGREADAKGLEAKLNMMKQIREYEALGLSTSLATAQAQKDAAAIIDAEARKALGDRIKEGTKQREEEIKGLAKALEDSAVRAEKATDEQLQHELALAQAAGEVAKAKALQAQIAERALSKQFQEVDQLGPDEAQTKAHKWITETDQATMTGQIRQSFRDGAKAALTGDVVGFAQSLADRFATRLSDKLGDTLFNLFDSLISQLGNNGSNGFGSFLSSVGSFIFGGGHATGGEMLSGYAYRAAEHDTELALIGRSGKVFNHDETVALLQSATAAKGGGLTVHAPVQFSIDARGAGPREIDNLRAEMRQMQASMPGKIIETVNDGLQRRMIQG